MLARLKLTDDEYGESVEKLSKIVDFVDQLSQADTAGVVPMAHPLDAVQRLRPDVVTEPDARDRYQQNAPSVADGLYLAATIHDLGLRQAFVRGLECRRGVSAAELRPIGGFGDDAFGQSVLPEL